MHASTRRRTFTVIEVMDVIIANWSEWCANRQYDSRAQSSMRRGLTRPTIMVPVDGTGQRVRLLPAVTAGPTTLYAPGPLLFPEEAGRMGSGDAPPAPPEAAAGVTGKRRREEGEVATAAPVAATAAAVTPNNGSGSGGGGARARRASSGARRPRASPPPSGDGAARLAGDGGGGGGDAPVASKGGAAGPGGAVVAAAPANPAVTNVPADWLRPPPGTPVRLSERDDRAPALVLHPGGLSMAGHLGYRSARATHGVRSGGTWYWEATLLSTDAAGVKGNVRVGWSTRRADVETPVGYASGSYGLRDRSGEVVTAARLRPYLPGPLAVGDVVGLALTLPDTLPPEVEAAVDKAEAAWAAFKWNWRGHGKMPPDSGSALPGARLSFSVNGRWGDDVLSLPPPIPAGSGGAAAPPTAGATTASGGSTAAGSTAGGSAAPAAAPLAPSSPAGLLAADYFPTVSCYREGRVRVNFGPTFAHPPPSGGRPFCEVAGVAPPPPSPPPLAPLSAAGVPMEGVSATAAPGAVPPAGTPLGAGAPRSVTPAG